jgi:hypothetical protein
VHRTNPTYDISRMKFFCDQYSTTKSGADNGQA